MAFSADGAALTTTWTPGSGEPHITWLRPDARTGATWPPGSVASSGCSRTGAKLGAVAQPPGALAFIGARWQVCLPHRSEALTLRRRTQAERG